MEEVTSNLTIDHCLSRWSILLVMKWYTDQPKPKRKQKRCGMHARALGAPLFLWESFRRATSTRVAKLAPRRLLVAIGGRQTSIISYPQIDQPWEKVCAFFLHSLCLSCLVTHESIFCFIL